MSHPTQRVLPQVFIWLMALSWILATSTLVCRCTTAADFVNTPEVRCLNRLMLFFCGENYLDL
ncbi:hypothetical protein IscW_ISCW007895 [Ixodes scapularis]|uniref:Uncharacterized protein n=1 Tax=Ixodes scapularis TaxID=6945 RepID=B7PUB9_IXOSC|nr:hypothetical protein IscW_ISCW007895 [Ixodes scapularis]|eukprot:XP_002405891.1 hypothetical protein IscW_ISCW007895 [Ixodes scapularis]